MLIRSIKYEVKRKEELEIANAKLLKLDKAKSEFISMASHQLRTPLTSIKGFISIMKNGTYGEIPENFKEPINHIDVANNRLVNVVEDMLNVSQIETGQMAFNFKIANVNGLVEELFQSFELMAQEKKLKLVLKLGKNIPDIAMDYGKIREMVSNIIDNAIKYTEKGTVTIKTVKRSNNDFVQIIVSDTGIGISSKDIGKVFDKFSRGEKAQQMKKGGVGLGLYLGKKIAEAHHGRIKVVSTGKSRGSMFTVELPVNQNSK